MESERDCGDEELFGDARAYVRESGRLPDDPPDVRPFRDRACWHHDDLATCEAKRRALSVEEAARREAAIGLETLIWLHARRSLGRIPHRAFLERFEPSRRWERGTPRFGLARGAVYYHLPDLEGRTLAERFEESSLATRICAAERAWLDAEKAARMSFYWVSEVRPSTFRLNDSFPGLGGGKSVVLPYGEIEPGEVAPCQTVFARIVTWREQPCLDLLQYDTTVRARLSDPTAPVRHACESPHDLREPAAFVRALFQAWEATAGPFPSHDI